MASSENVDSGETVWVLIEWKDNPLEESCFVPFEEIFQDKNGSQFVKWNNTRRNVQVLRTFSNN